MMGVADDKLKVALAQELGEWVEFYRDYRIPLDSSALKIPEKQPGFDRLIVVAQEVTPQWAYERCAELFLCSKWTDKSLDDIINSERTSKDGAYAVWFRDCVEADEELKNLSANDLRTKGIPGITLEERLLMELKYFKETGKHLDIVNITLCSGSRGSDGFVPKVDWSPVRRRLDVGWYSPGISNPLLRSRRAVSL